MKFRPVRFRQTYKFLIYINDKYGGRTWARTKDPLIKSQLLYQLSYASMPIGNAATRPRAACCGRASNKRRGPVQALYSRRDWLRCWRSSAMRMPRQSMIVITADPPKLTRGRGTPTTGASPMTIIRLIVT